MNNPRPSSPPLIDDVLQDPATSDWLRYALKTMLYRDHLDTVNNAKLLYEFLDRPADFIMNRHVT